MGPDRQGVGCPARRCAGGEGWVTTIAPSPAKVIFVWIDDNRDLERLRGTRPRKARRKWLEMSGIRDRRLLPRPTRIRANGYDSVPEHAGNRTEMQEFWACASLPTR